jgi:hypothetical protein
VRETWYIDGPRKSHKRDEARKDVWKKEDVRDLTCSCPYKGLCLGKTHIREALDVSDPEKDINA